MCEKKCVSNNNIWKKVMWLFGNINEKQYQYENYYSMKMAINNSK